jgi:hypothetical protein
MATSDSSTRSGSASPLGSSLRNAADIAAEMRRDFQRAYQAQFDRAPAQDPVLTTLMQALAVQVGRVYQEAEDTFPWQVLDDLMHGLAMPRLTPTPAQVVMAFRNLDTRERIGPDLSVQGLTPTGEYMTFAPDVSIELAPSTLVFAGVAERGELQVVPGASLRGNMPWPPNRVRCAAATGAPALLLAFDCDVGHLSGLGVHVNTGGVTHPVTAALQRSPWILLGNDGVSRDAGTMRRTIGRGGVNLLEWFDMPRTADDVPVDGVAQVDVGSGPFGEQLWVFPPVPTTRRWRSAPPRAYASAIQSLLPDGDASWVDRPLAWVLVPLPAGTPNVATAIQAVTINAVTASNVEVFTEQVSFGRAGQVVALRPEGDDRRHLLGVLSVVGESGARYVPDADLDAPGTAGRWRARDGRIELRPARRDSGRSDSFAALRLLLCDGARANAIEPGAITRINGTLDNVVAQTVNLTTSRGGASPPPYNAARLRFAELLRTRERVVTTADYDIAARAYEPRIAAVSVEAMSEIADGALRAVDCISVQAPRAEFADPEADAVRLRDGLERHLTGRAVLGRSVRVTVELVGR